jgi:tRNA(Ile2)-agmatinylcytidine synthase
LKDESRRIDCAAYEPTGVLRKVAMRLIGGDVVEVYGAVRPPAGGRPLTVNLEKIRVIRLAPKLTFQNPICPKCGKRLKSMGKGQGFRCEKCGSRNPSLTKTALSIERDLKKGLHFTSTRSQRHLTKPLRRYGLEKRRPSFEGMVEGWHSPWRQSGSALNISHSR